MNEGDYHCYCGEIVRLCGWDIVDPVMDMLVEKPLEELRQIELND
jgi:hypothetical protein